MSFHCEVRHEHGVAVVDVSGRISLGPDSDALRETLIGLFDLGHRRLVVNLREVASADSAALGDLVAAHNAITARGGIVCVAGPNQRLAELLRLTGLDRLLAVCADEATALARLCAVALGNDSGQPS